jgi:hypothetical protein
MLTQVVQAFGTMVQAKLEYEYSEEIFTQAAVMRLLLKAENVMTT